MWGWNVYDAGGVPSQKQIFGPVGAPTKSVAPYPAGPADLSNIVETPLQNSGGCSAHNIDPWAGRRRVQIDAPVEFQGARIAPSYVEPQNSSLGNAIIRVLPCNPHTTPLICPPAIICPQLARAGSATAVQQATFGRGGKPRSVQLPEGVSTPSPSVVTRWSTYG